MSKTFLPYDLEQQLLLPAALQEWLPDDHLAYFISDVVDQLDLSAITGRYEEQRGGPPYHPRMMVKILLYGYCTEVEELLRRAGEVDEEEDRRYGGDKGGDELPEELTFPGGTAAEDQGGQGGAGGRGQGGAGGIRGRESSRGA